jgi:hypothetical protein
MWKLGEDMTRFNFVSKPLDARTLVEFWPAYLSMHRRLATRIFHFVGTGLQVPLIVACIMTRRWLLLLALPVVSYGFAWFSHFAFERNRPATWSNPWLSLICDYKMFGMMACGKLWK